MAQPSATPLEFEIASIRPGNLESPQVYPSISAGRFHAENVTLRALIEEAYGLKPLQLTEGPRWIGSDRFTIKAQGAPSTSNLEVKLMLRSLLKERFQLCMHIEAREQPIYALQVRDRSKLKLQRSLEGDSRLTVSSKSATDLAIAYTFRNFTMQRLADQLFRETQRIVKDETGLDGEFDFELHTFRDPEEKGGIMVRLAPLISEIGLGIESRRDPVEFYIVDRAEPPSEN